MTYRVYDDRTNETIFETTDKFEAMEFMAVNYDENHPDFEHVWLEKI